MALGLLLQVSWIFSLLIHSSSASVKGYGKKDIRNIGFDDDDDAPPHGSVERPTNTGASAYRPGPARWQGWAGRKTPVRPSFLDIERLERGKPVVGVQERPDQPLVFPLQGSFGNAPPAPPSQGSADPPGSDWQPKPASGGGNEPLIYEDIFKYPPQGSGAPQGQDSPPQGSGAPQGQDSPPQGSGAPQGQDSPPQAAGGSSQGSQPSHALLQRQPVKGGAWLFQPSRPVSSHQSGSQPHGGVVSWQRNPAGANQAPQRGSAPVGLPPPSYLIQSSNSYQRYRKSYRKSKYTPEFAAPQPEGSPVLQPAAPPSFQGPHRAKV